MEGCKSDNSPFDNRQSANKHFGRMHQALTDELLHPTQANDKKEYKCRLDNCGKKYLSKEKLISHICRRHQGHSFLGKQIAIPRISSAQR